MSNLSPNKNPRPNRESRPDVHLPDGEVLTPRARFAQQDAGGICDKTASRLNLPTTYIGGVAYVKRNAALKIIGERAQQRNVPRTGKKRKVA